MLSRSFEQVVPSEKWPSGDRKPISVVDLEPNQIRDRFGLRFVRDEDDLDQYELAAIRLASGTEVWLIRYLHSPSPGTIIYADSGVNASHVRRELLGALGLKPEEETWKPDAAL
jgi:hypothetical protein